MSRDGKLSPGIYLAFFGWPFASLPVNATQLRQPSRGIDAFRLFKVVEDEP